MKNDEIGKAVNNDFLQSVSDVLAQAQKNAKTAVNLSMVYAYYEIGRMIVEEEQHGSNRAAYGKYLLQALSDYLLQKFGKGFSVTNLKQMRQFYLTYANDAISQTVSDQFEHLPTVSTGRKFFLSWSHYLKLMRCFYSVYLHDWIGETVFTRLILSKDYAQILRANTKLFCLKKKICKSCWRNSYPRTGVKTIEAAI